MTKQQFIVALSLVVAPALLSGQGKGLDPADILKPLKDEWLTYNGDYSGKRYSLLKDVNQQTVKNLTLGWFAKLTPGNGPGVIVGGEGTGDFPPGGGAIKGSALMVDGTIYISTPDNAYAFDARDGRQLWHYWWKTRGSTHIGNRGMGMWHNYLYMETPDDYLVSLDAKTGKERWHVTIADLAQQYFSTPAPIVVGDEAAGKTYFAANCASCHSTTGDLAGIGGRMPDAKTLQNLWVSGGAVGGGGGGRRGRGAGAAADPRVPTVTVTTPAGERLEGTLVKIDDFIVTMALADGTLRSVRRDGDRPTVDVKDPLVPHRELWKVLGDKDMHDVTAYLVTVK